MLILNYVRILEVLLNIKLMFSFLKKHENYKELIWTLAKTDFKLRYHDSVLGYIWALLKPLLMFAVLNFVFSSIFNPKTTGSEYYSLQLITALMMFTFFNEGTTAGMGSLLMKSQLVTKIYVPRWTIILASTVNAALIYLMNLIVIAGFFLWKGYLPGLLAIGMFLFFSFLIYILVLSFSLVTAPLYIKFRDLLLIWEVIVMIMMYASPIIYPLTMLPDYIQRVILINPVAFIIHFTKESLINNHFPEFWQFSVFVFLVFILFSFSIFIYNKLSFKIAEDI